MHRTWSKLVFRVFWNVFSKSEEAQKPGLAIPLYDRDPVGTIFLLSTKVILKEGWPCIWAHRVKASNQGNYCQAYRCDITYAWLAQWGPIDVTSFVYGLPKWRCCLTKFVYFCVPKCHTLLYLLCLSTVCWKHRHLIK